MKNIIASALVLAPLTICADGLGLYVPISFGTSETRSYALDEGGSAEGTINYDNGTGFGIAYDSNLGKGNLYNYRFALEFRDDKPTEFNAVTRTTYNMIHTFGFGVYNNEKLRIFLGPQINFQFAQHSYDFETDDAHYQVGGGIAGVAGLNYSFNKYFALAADLNYNLVYIAGVGDAEQAYTGKDKAVSARFYAFFKFGETYEGKEVPSDNDSTEDSTSSDNLPPSLD